MARKFLYFVAFCIVVFIGGRLALAFYPEQLTRLSFTPGGKFEAQPDLAANAYANPDLWFARPGMSGSNPVQWQPEGFNPDPVPVDAAVFFVHPTTYLKRRTGTDRWTIPTRGALARSWCAPMPACSAPPAKSGHRVTGRRLSVLS